MVEEVGVPSDFIAVNPSDHDACRRPTIGSASVALAETGIGRFCWSLTAGGQVRFPGPDLAGQGLVSIVAATLAGSTSIGKSKFGAVAAESRELACCGSASRSNAAPGVPWTKAIRCWWQVRITLQQRRLRCACQGVRSLPPRSRRVRFDPADLDLPVGSTQ